MIAIRKLNTLGLKNSTDFVLGFIGDDGGALTVALTSFYQWNGRLHHGKHEPLVSIDLWERVQGVLAGRHATPIPSYGYKFAFSGLMTCAECGRGGGQDGEKHLLPLHGTCRQRPGGLPSARRVSIPAPPPEPDERREQEQAIERCQTQYKRLEDRLNAMYLDKLDGRIDNAFYDRISAQWRVEQTRLLREIERHLRKRPRLRQQHELARMCRSRGIQFG